MRTLVISLANLDDDGDLNHEIFKIESQESLDSLIKNLNYTEVELSLDFLNLGKNMIDLSDKFESLFHDDTHSIKTLLIE